MADTRWLSAAEQQTWRSFLSACRTIFSEVEAELLRDAGMPLAYYEILVRLSETPGRALRMSQLAEATATSKSRASHAVARLEERGWIRRVDCPTDRRGQIAELTAEGYAVLAAAAPGHVEQVRKVLFDALTPEQVAQLKEIAWAVAAAGDPVPAGFPASCLGDDEPADAGDGAPARSGRR